MRVRYSFGSRHTGNTLNIKKQRAKYPDVMKDVIRISDIVLHILDARYIEKMRNLAIEQDVIDKGKRMIFVLNKADLVDKKKIEETLPLEVRPYVFVSAKTGQGARELRERIKIESTRVDMGEKKRVHVGVIGYPNAGKSSIINLITRRGVAKISKQAGFTKGMQKIRMSEGILILDTPGVIPDAEYSSDKKELASRDAQVGARTFSDVKEPEYVVATIMKEHPGILERYYHVEV